MAAMASLPPLDHKTGFSNSTRTFHSLQSTSLTLPPHDQRISVASFALRRLRPDDNDHSTAAIIDSTTGRRLSFADFLNQVRSLAASLLQWLSKGSVAFVLAPNSPSSHLPSFQLASSSRRPTLSARRQTSPPHGQIWPARPALMSFRE